LKLDKKSSELLEEAVKWSVFFENKPTKIKNKENVEIIEYVLNPIYSPYFTISYRKIRKLEFTSDQINALVNGSIDDYKFICRKFSPDSGERTFDDYSDLFSPLSLF
jgi:rRNA processing protein Gar1